MFHTDILGWNVQVTQRRLMCRYVSLLGVPLQVGLSVSSPRFAVGFPLQSLTHFFPTRLRYVSFCAEILAATGGCVITAQRKHSGCPCFMYLRYIAQMQPWLSHPDNALWRHRSAALTYTPKGLEPDVKSGPERNTKLLKIVSADYQSKTKGSLTSDRPSMWLRCISIKTITLKFALAEQGQQGLTLAKLRKKSVIHLSFAGSFPSSCRMPDLWVSDRETLHSHPLSVHESWRRHDNCQSSDGR